jgi:phosphate-selective porin
LKRTLFGTMLAVLLAAGYAIPASAGPIIDTRGKLEIRSEDGDFRWRLDGRVHADANWFQDHNGVDFGSGSHLRRARLGMNGRLWRSWHFKFQYDFTGSGRSGVQDAFIQYTRPEGMTVTMGHFKEPLGLEVLTGANNVSFIERSLPSVLGSITQPWSGHQCTSGKADHGHDRTLWRGHPEAER